MRLAAFLVAIATLVPATVLAQCFDEKTTNALKLCHDYVWFDVPEFKDLPNAAISVFPGITLDSAITVFWNVMWDDPNVRAAGNCTVAENKVQGFEDYTKN